MRAEVELHPDVVWFIRKRCNRQEQDAFYQQLEAIRVEPLKNSEHIADPELSRYMLRFFRFGMNLAIFEFDPQKPRIKVLECRRVLPRKRRKQEEKNGGASIP